MPAGGMVTEYPCGPTSCRAKIRINSRLDSPVVPEKSLFVSLKASHWKRAGPWRNDPWRNSSADRCSFERGISDGPWGNASHAGESEHVDQRGAYVQDEVSRHM